MENQQKLINKLEKTSSGWTHYLGYIVAAFIVCAEAISAFVVFPKLLQQAVDNNKMVADLQSEIDRLDSAINVLSNSDGQKVHADLAMTVAALPSEKKVSGIVSSLTSLASSSGVLVKELQLTPCGISTRSATPKTVKTNASLCENVKLEQGVSGIPMSMQVQSEQPQLAGFIANLHHVSPLLGIRSIDYNYNATGKVADVSLLLFFQPVVNQTFKVDDVSAIGKDKEDLLKDLSNQVIILP